MTTLLISHPASLEHLTPPGHPERVDRIKAVNAILANRHFAELKRIEAPLGADDDISRAHPDDYIRTIRSAVPDEGFEQIDVDTVMSPGSLEAALRGVGAGIAGVDAV